MGGGVNWMETHSYERSREHGVAVALQAGTYRHFEMKHGGVSVEDV
jgi:hypothetical protein